MKYHIGSINYFHCEQDFLFYLLTHEHIHSQTAFPLALLSHFNREGWEKPKFKLLSSTRKPTFANTFPRSANGQLHNGRDPKLNAKRGKKNSISGKQTQGKYLEIKKKEKTFANKREHPSFHRENVPVNRGVEKMSVCLF